MNDNDDRLVEVPVVLRVDPVTNEFGNHTVLWPSDEPMHWPPDLFERTGVQRPKALRTDPWGLGFTEEECRRWLRGWRAEGSYTENKIARALAPLVAAWEEEDARG